MDETKAAEAPRDQFAPPTPEEESELAKELRGLLVEAKIIRDTLPSGNDGASGLLRRGEDLCERLFTTLSAAGAEPATEDFITAAYTMQHLLRAMRLQQKPLQRAVRIDDRVVQLLVLRALRAPLTADVLAELLGVTVEVKLRPHVTPRQRG